MTYILEQVLVTRFLLRLSLATPLNDATAISIVCYITMLPSNLTTWHCNHYVYPHCPWHGLAFRQPHHRYGGRWVRWVVGMVGGGYGWVGWQRYLAPKSLVDKYSRQGSCTMMINIPVSRWLLFIVWRVIENLKQDWTTLRFQYDWKGTFLIWQVLSEIRFLQAVIPIIKTTVFMLRSVSLSDDLSSKQ